MSISRRSLFALLAAAPALKATLAHAVDALPAARFVGFCQAVNEFEINSGRLALSRSSNENIRAFATRAVAEYTDAASALSRSRSEAGVSYAPDGQMGPTTANFMNQLNSLQGPQFDSAYANAQLAVQTASEAQIAAYSQNGDTGALRRYAQNFLPKAQMHLEFAKRIAGGVR